MRERVLLSQVIHLAFLDAHIFGRRVEASLSLADALIGTVIVDQGDVGRTHRQIPSVSQIERFDLHLSMIRPRLARGEEGKADHYPNLTQNEKSADNPCYFCRIVIYLS